MIIIGLHGGLNNKLIPLYSLLRLKDKLGLHNEKIHCYWGLEPGFKKEIDIKYNDIFEVNDNITFITKSQYLKHFNDKTNTIINTKTYYKDLSITTLNPIIFNSIKNDSKNIIINYIIHPLNLEKDNAIPNYIPYPRTSVSSNLFINDLRKEVTNLKLKKELKDKLFIFTQPTLGIHIRNYDGGFKMININNSIIFVNKFLKSNPEWNIYVSTDSLENENILKSNIINSDNNLIFNSNYIGNTYNDKFNRNTYASINGIIEMFNLSNCDKFVGTPGSSFTFMTWLLRNDNILDFWCDNPWN